MAAHDLPLTVIEWTKLGEDRLIDTQFTDIMSQAAMANMHQLGALIPMVRASCTVRMGSNMARYLHY